MPSALVGHGRLPFEGSAMELLHSVVQKQPAYIHEVRRDVPEVLSKIVDKVSHRSPLLFSRCNYLFQAPCEKP